MKQRLGIATLALVLAALGTVAAQEQATVLKRDGTRVSGRFEAWNRNTNTLYLRVSQGDQQIIPLGDAAVLEVGGNADNLPAAELDAARSGDHVLVLTNGDVVRGKLLNIEGGEGSGTDGDRQLAFQPSSGTERRVRFSEVRRLYLGNFPASLNSSGTATSTAPGIVEPPVTSGAIRVAGNAGWVPTGITVRRTDRVSFSTQGQVQLSTDPEDRAGSAGSLKGRFAANAPAPTLLAGALIGRIGNGPAFAIGDQTQALPMPGDGPLSIAVNDDEVSDNQGAFVVTLQVTRGRR